MSETRGSETHVFQTEVKQLLHLMVHSLYSNKEIFLRELISNAADAADKLRFKALENDSLYGDDNLLKIRVTVDKEAGTLTISDNGIGISPEEVEDIFKPFYRGVNALQMAGSGVGLTIVSRIIEAHRGEIWAESDGNTGTKFYFTLQ